MPEIQKKSQLMQKWHHWSLWATPRYEMIYIVTHNWWFFLFLSVFYWSNIGSSSLLKMTMGNHQPDEQFDVDNVNIDLS